MGRVIYIREVYHLQQGPVSPAAGPCVTYSRALCHLQQDPVSPTAWPCVTYSRALYPTEGPCVTYSKAVCHLHLLQPDQYVTTLLDCDPNPRQFITVAGGEMQSSPAFSVDIDPLLLTGTGCHNKLGPDGGKSKSLILQVPLKRRTECRSRGKQKG